ncbi:MAG: T9SS type A sorting domain-containing protein [Bacteroidota bacterium]
MSRLAATLLLTLLAPLAFTDAPDWPVDASAYGTSMTITAAVDLGHTTASAGDVLGVYARDAASGLDVWRGVGEATTLNSTTVRFLLTVYGDTDGEALYLRYYDASADGVYRTDHSFTYEANRVFGTIAAPVFIDRFTRESGAPAWTIDPASFGLSMSVTARVAVDGVTATVQDRLAAFSGGTLRGVATPAQVGQDALFFLTVYAADASETIDFRLYDASADTVYAIRELLLFQANSRQGSATAPLDLVARTQDLRPTLALFPADGAEAASAEVTLRWRPDPAATAYRVQVATDASFTDLLHDAKVTQPEHALPLLTYSTTYHWRVQSVAGVDAGRWSTFRFATATGVASEHEAPLSGFVLHANHPNPFGHETQIRYTLGQSASVVLTVHDLLGREVARLQDSAQPAGTHTVRFTPANVPNGLYLYRLHAGTQVATRTMTLIR